LRCCRPAGLPVADAPSGGEPVVVVNAPTASKTWTIADLERLAPVEVEWTHHEQTHKFHGVPLTKVIGSELALSALVDPNKDTWSRIVGIVARDGYRVVFSAGELREGWGPTHAFLVWRQDGAPLSIENGPFQIVVPTDAGGARCVRQVVQIRVVDCAPLLPPRAKP
jgi:DMSO/TMAO reductase YedYZ molybdopterin-dependent catalytic subunit